MKIKTKLQVVSIAPVLVFLLLMAVQSGLSIATDRRHAQEEVVSSLARDISDLTTLTYEYGISRGARARMQWTVQQKQMEVLLNESDTLFKELDERKLLDDFRSLLANADKRFRALSAYDAEVRKPGQSYSIRNNMINGLILEMQEMSPLIDRMHALINAATTRLSRYMNIMTGVSGFMIVLVISPVLFFTIKRITLPIDSLHEGMRIIASGDLQHRVPVDSADEIGVLSQGFNEMAGRIQEITVSREELTREIVVRRQTEETLRIREMALNEAQHLGQIGNWDWDAVHDTIWWSEEYYRIYDIASGTPPPNYEEHKNAYTQESAARLDAAVKLAMETGTPYELDLELANPTPTTQWICARCEVKRDAGGKIWGLRGTAQNITERKQTEHEIQKAKETLVQRVVERTADLENKSSELQESQLALMNIVEDLNEKTMELEQANARLHELDQLKSLFIASMSHELRTPLNSIIGFSSIMLNEWAGPVTAEQKENLSAVLRSGKHLLSLINDVIDVSKIEAGKIESLVEDFDVREVVMEAVETVKKDIEKKGLELKVNVPNHAMHTDRRRFLQCLLNLLSNAVKYTQHGSVDIHVDRSPDGSMLTVAIGDTGIGIREDDLDKLFLPFVRLHAPMDSIIPGTGLGLYLTNKLTREILRGDILVSSTYGAGSRFTLRVPVAG